VAAQKIGAGLQAILRHQQIAFVPKRAATRVACDLDLATHHNRLFRAGLLAQSAKHASRHIDVENFGIAFDFVGGLGGKDRDAGGGTGPFAQPARDASLLAVLHLHQHRHPAHRRRVNKTLLGKMDGEILTSAHEAEEIAQQMRRSDPQPHQHRPQRERSEQTRRRPRDLYHSNSHLDRVTLCTSFAVPRVRINLAKSA
jgi:hypothetical protein